MQRECTSSLLTEINEKEQAVLSGGGLKINPDFDFDLGNLNIGGNGGSGGHAFAFTLNGDAYANGGKGGNGGKAG